MEKIKRFDVVSNNADYFTEYRLINGNKFCKSEDVKALEKENKVLHKALELACTYEFESGNPQIDTKEVLRLIEQAKRS